MRKETSNQFTEGLVSDLNPINTPNTVLTDNLNGTVITYNGNEFSLQNDMGNYELKYCRLKPNYIPVGIKEYGDILYIVSYNPLDRHVEIGSYPSPLMITTPDLKNSNNAIDSIIDENIVNLGLPEGSYLELLNKADRIIFNGENFKLNPGDEYCLQLFDKKLYKYETIDYFILDDDAGTFNVTDKIKVDPDNGDPDYEYVPWTIPGWIMIKSRLAELSTSGINIRYFYVPKQEYSKSAYFSLNIRLNVNDPFLTKKNDNDQSILDEWCKGIEKKDLKDISFRVYLERSEEEKWKSLTESEYIEFSISNENSSNLIYLGESGWVEWYDDSRILWKNISGTIKDLKENDLIRIKIIPILSESEYKILYDNLEQTLIFDLAGIDDTQWHVGKSIYKFELDDFETEQIIYTDITGPVVSSTPVSLYYEISDLKGNIVKNGKFDDYSGIGENVLKIKFDENFKSENIYILKFLFKSDISGETINESKRFLVTSVIFKDFMDRSIFDKDIAFEEWINKYWEHCKINVNFEYNGYTVGENFERISELTAGDNKYLSNVLFGRFHLADGSDLSETIFKHYGTYYDVNGSLGIDEQLLEGDLWNGIQSKYTFLYGSETEKQSYIAGDPIRLSCYEEEVYKYRTLTEPFDFANIDIRRFDTEEIFVDNDPMNRWSAKLELWSIRLKMIFNKDKITCKMQVGTYNEDWTAGKKWTACKTAFGYENEYTLEMEVKGGKVGNMNKLFESLFLMLPYNIEACLFEVKYEFQKGFKMWSAVYGEAMEWDNNLEPPFIFKVDKDETIENNYFIILRQTEFDYNPILLPLTDSKDDYLNMYRVFCRNLSVITSYENPGIYSEYKLCIDSSKTESDLKLNIYLKGSFNSEHKYSDIKLFDRKERSNLISNIGVVYDNIFIGSLSGTYDSTESLVYSSILNSNVFSPDTWHTTRKNEFQAKLAKINSDRNDDYEFFWESTYGNSLKDRVIKLNTAKGFYMDKIISDDQLLIYMSNNYIKTGRCGESYDPSINESTGWIVTYWKNTTTALNLIFYGNVCRIERNIRLDHHWPWLRQYES